MLRLKWWGWGHWCLEAKTLQEMAMLAVRGRTGHTVSFQEPLKEKRYGTVALSLMFALN